MNKQTFSFVLCIQLLLCSFQLSAGATLIEDKALLPILTPTFSERQTLKIQLENGLQAYIISDPRSDKSSAALTVKTGSWEDPAEYPGIAHFLEHMLFLGNKKYPHESEFDRFISENGGQFNAFTANDFTGYVFTVNNTSLPEALDRFSSFFKDPLFNPSGVDRELQAIDQEYAKNLENDDIREYYIHKELVNPGHPNGAFSMGNRESLQKVSQETLKKWHQTHYSGNRMQVEVISSLPMEELKKIVVEDFSGIPTSNIAPFIPAIPIISDASKGHMIFIDPVKNIRRLVMVWELPFKFASMRETKPELLVCYILGHEGKNSLLAQLKQEKLVESLQCGTDKIGGNSFALILQMDLTDAGVKNADQVIMRSFEAIANIKKKGIPDYLVEELKTMSKLNYQFQPRRDAFENIIKEAMLLPHENMETYPEHTLVFQKYDPAATAELIQYMTPENALFELMAPKSLTGVNFESKEKWLGVSYTIKALPQETLTAWKNASPAANIGFPEANPYLPINIDLITKSAESSAFSLPTPSILLDNDNGQIYFAQDTYYSVPTISWTFAIKTPAIDPTSIESIVMADIYVKHITETLSAYVYPASVGGLNFSVQQTHNGLSISIDGYNDKSKALFQDLLLVLKEFKPREQKFKTYKEILLRDYQNVSLEMPLMQAFEALQSILHKDFFMGREKAAAIKKISFDQFQDFNRQLFEKTFVEGMMYGNMDVQEAQAVTSYLIATLDSQPYPKSEQKSEEIIVLPKDQGPFYIETKSKVQGNAAILTIGLDPFSFKERAAQQVLMQAIKEPFFSTLRTKQQTGYIVFSKADELEKHLFDIFAVQSNTHEGRDLLARFELFIEGFLQELSKSEVTEERFEKIKMALLTTLRQPPQNSTEMAALLYKMAFTYNGDFKWIDKRIKSLEELSYSEFLNSAILAVGKENKRRIAIILTGATDANLKYKRLNGVGQLKDQSTYEAASQEPADE